MNTMMKGLIAVLLLIVSGAVVLAGDAPIQDEPLPPEVKKLIGMKLPPEIINMKQREIPGFVTVRGGILAGPEKEDTSAITYAEGLLDEKITVFFIERIYPDRTMEILDARLLPAALLSWRLEEGKPTRGSGRYRLSAHCRVNKSNSRNILGLIRPEEGKESCAHFSRQIKQAWRLDTDSSRLVSISSKELECEYITMDSCY